MDLNKKTDGPNTASAEGRDYHLLPDWDVDFYDDEDIAAFASALAIPDAITSPSEEDLLSTQRRANAQFITALNDWRPVYQRRIRRSLATGSGSRRTSTKKRRGRRGKDETREGWTYAVAKYPLLFFVFGWISFLGICYLLTRFYIYLYEHFVTWRGTREKLRQDLASKLNYEDWVKSAKGLDSYLGNEKWKVDEEGSYYDWRMIKGILRELRKLRQAAQEQEHKGAPVGKRRAIDDLRATLETCVKANFAGTENHRLYSETYYGTKNLLQEYINEVAESLKFLLSSQQLTTSDQRQLSQHFSANLGRIALCLSGGATFAYYHFGIAKALLDANLLPTIITGTSGGALIAALLATRTDEELKKLLVPALAYKIRACQEPFSVWGRRWWRTGARFDSVDWAKKCSWFCRGSLTFLEAYQRTGRILNVSCVPSDPHSPTILANYLTAPDCVVWSAVLASAAVPGILNPVVLMRKNRDGKLEPYSFGHKWKDGSLRTDIPLKSLNLHFNVNFSIVSQVNPHVSLWFFSSRGTVGRPVTHRRGRGWRGGFLGSAIEQFIKLDLNKWLKVLRHLELLPRPLGQDWSEVFLQRFSGTITIWPKTKVSDFYHILSDPSIDRLAGMILAGQLAAWPKLKFISNRMAIEKVIEDARIATRPAEQPLPTPMPSGPGRLRSVLSEEDLQTLLEQARGNNGLVEVPASLLTPRHESAVMPQQNYFTPRTPSPSLTKRWWSSSTTSVDTIRPAKHSPAASTTTILPATTADASSLTVPPDDHARHQRRGSSVVDELVRQSRVFFDDYEPSDAEADKSAGEETTEDEGIYSEEDEGSVGTLDGVTEGLH